LHFLRLKDFPFFFFLERPPTWLMGHHADRKESLSKSERFFSQKKFSSKTEGRWNWKGQILGAAAN